MLITVAFVNVSHHSSIVYRLWRDLRLLNFATQMIMCTVFTRRDDSVHGFTCSHFIFVDCSEDENVDFAQKCGWLRVIPH